MKCECGRYLTQQSRVVAKINRLDGSECLFCMAARLSVPYQDLLDQYQGIYDCRECTKKAKAEERRRRLGL
ncbi:hypothetical protein IAQ67_28430 (plasmid) [Paenibacillus peoriae]|uniref:Uncharacterized protein n=1 Tax=Paenibacillus peoriae TaxID=59893 RepID=A0A7H0YH88_9BACL|nr:hypothetical protein [Paenibacillus peoriae]QNR70446.1 hypothetical protein IAQ67_28430 [Paenibacillus peoriae]